MKFMRKKNAKSSVFHSNILLLHSTNEHIDVPDEVTLTIVR